MPTERFPLLMDLIREHAITRHRKVLTCAPDVEEALRASSVAAEVPPPPMIPAAVLAMLMGIDVIVAEDAPPGSWTLVRHDHCKVLLGTVTHQDCTIISRQEGTPPWAPKA